MNEEDVGKVDSAFHAHTELGPGLLESLYEGAMTFDLGRQGLKVEPQKPIPVFFDGTKLEVGFLINFNEEHLKNGITRIVNALEGKGSFRNPRTAISHPSIPSRDQIVSRDGSDGSDGA